MTELFNLLGISDLTTNYPSALSGGEKQRVAIAIARALYNDPKIILADEPTASLDTKRALQVVALLANIAHKTKRGVIMITHDTRLLDDVDTLYEMRDGQLKQLRDRAAKKVTPNPA